MIDPFEKFEKKTKALERELGKLDEEPKVVKDFGEKKKEERDLSGWAYFADLVMSVAVIFGVAWFVRTMVISPFYVEGSSMVPTLEDGDFLIVNKLGFHFWDPERGDTVIFRPPDQPGIFYVKRVIGLPGETLSFEGGEVKVINNEHPEGWLLEENYLNVQNKGKTWLPAHKDQKIYVPEERYFLMGDNRNHSSDSRAWTTLHPDVGGTVPGKMIVGEAEVRAWIPEKVWWKLGLPHFEVILDGKYEG